MLLGESVHVRPEGETDEVRATVPVNPLTGATVIVEAAAVPTVVVTELGLAVNVKSWTLNVTVALAELAPLVPVTVTVKLLAVGEVQDSVDVPEVPVMLVGLRV